MAVAIKKKSATPKVKKVSVKKTSVTKTKKKTTSEKPAIKEMAVTNEKGKKRDKNYFPFIIAIVAVAAIVFAIIFTCSKKKVSVVETVQSVEELKEKTNVSIIPPQNAKTIKYSVENKNIARVEYSKEFENGYTMDFVLKSSSATEDLVEYDNDFGSTPIKMTVICNDGSDIEVTSYLAIDNTTIMKSEWYDNDLYCAMTTENLSTREDFLQEVNRVIIDNHVEF